MTSFETLFPYFAFLVGALFGSFANVIIVRMPHGKSIAWPWSHCVHCKTRIKPWDNVPILSFLFLRGKCRTCHKAISPRYPLVEFITAFLFAVVCARFGFTLTSLEYCIFAFMCVCCSFIDIEHRILPDRLTLTGIVLGLLGSLINPDRQFIDALLGLLAGGGFLWAVAYLYLLIRHEEGMGGGDIKLIAWIGSLLGWKSIIFCILLSSIAGALVGGVFAAIQRSGLKTTIPFGPFLISAAFVYIFFGTEIIDLYLKFFFPFIE